MNNVGILGSIYREGERDKSESCQNLMLYTLGLGNSQGNSDPDAAWKVHYYAYRSGTKLDILTRPFRFHVPTNILLGTVDEYSCILEIK